MILSAENGTATIAAFLLINHEKMAVENHIFAGIQRKITQVYGCVTKLKIWAVLSL